MSTSQRETKPREGGPEKSTRDLFRLDRRTILITGGGGAVGLEAAGAVLETGGDVICVDSHDVPSATDAWMKVIAKVKEHEGQISYYTCDITDAEGVHALFERATSNLRYPLRGLVCCAGVSGESPAVDYPIESFRRIVDINLCGTLICAQAAARVFCRQKIGGSVVLIASISGHVSNKGVDTAAYNSSKAAVLQLGRSLAAEWGSRPEYPLIRVNTLSPGYIRTQMTLGALQHPNREAEWSADNMMNRLSFADEYRGPIIFLLADASSFMTGADLVVDGGHTAW